MSSMSEPLLPSQYYFTDALILQKNSSCGDLHYLITQSTQQHEDNSIQQLLGKIKNTMQTTDFSS